MNDSSNSSFEQAAPDESGRGLLFELWLFLKSNKKWWLLPILIVFAMFGALLLLSGTAAAPFIYTLF